MENLCLPYVILVKKVINCYVYCKIIKQFGDIKPVVHRYLTAQLLLCNYKDAAFVLCLAVARSDSCVM